MKSRTLHSLVLLFLAFFSQSAFGQTGLILVGSGEYALSYLNGSGHWYGLGSLALIGNGFAGTAGLPYQVVTSPANLTYKATFGGLHNIAAIDSSGGLWLAGDNSQGQLGQGNTTVNYYGVKVATDSSGNAFTNINLFASYYTSNYSQGWYAIKTDGTLWMCGSGINGMRGNGTDGIGVDSIVSRPRQVPIPGGRIPKQIIGGQRIMILMTDSTVWTVGKANFTTDYGFTMSGNLYASLQQVPGLTGIVQIAGPISYNYALRSDGHLFGWGTFGSYMGNWGNPTTGSGTVLNSATDLKDSVVAYLSAPIAEIKTNQNVTVARCTDGTLWSWGDNSQGSVGNGHELNYRQTSPPFAWNFVTGTLLVRHPVRITGYSDFDTVFVTNNFGFNVQARRTNGQLLSWGRNKGGVLGNGQVPCSSGQAAVYPNAMDVVYPTVMNPLTLTAVTPITCPICKIAPGDSTCGDAGCAIPSVTTTCNAGGNQNITGTTATLTGTLTTNGTILSTTWSQVSGPNTAGFDLQSAPTAHLSGLTTGTYVFSYAVIDNGQDTVTSSTTVVVASGETHNFVTYDTTINFVCIPGYAGCVVGGVQQYFTLRISRPVNYFTTGNADTASRPLILTVPTDSAETDTSWLTRYGPHYWLKNGWDGSVTLENGKHYPLLITVIATSANVRPFNVQPLMDTLIKYFHPRAHSIHLMGTQTGFTSLGWYLWFQATAGDEHNMANVRSLTDLEGVNPATNYGVSTIGYPNAFGYWAQKYGGKFFGLEGSNTDRDIWQISENMNDSVSGSAYYSHEKAGGGNDGSYDSLYNPSVTNWTDTVPYGNTFITTVSPHVNTMGTYRYDPTTGTNIFQWALRQGDTTLVGPGTDTLAISHNIDSAQSALIVATTDTAGGMPLMIYPNPVSQQDVMLTFRNALTGKVSVTLINEAGVVVQTYQFSKPDAYFLQQLPVGRLAKGIYFIKVAMSGYHATKQLVRF